MDQTIDKNIISDKCTRMPPKLSPIWRYFEEDTNDPSTAICKVVGCKKPQEGNLEVPDECGPKSKQNYGQWINVDGD